MSNLIIINSAEGFARGSSVNLEPAGGLSGGLRLADGQTEGRYISEAFETEEWNDIVASWNADTPRGTKVEISGRAYIPEVEGWTDWITWGEWSPYIRRNCPECEDGRLLAFANSYGGAGDSSMNITDGRTAVKFQFRAVLTAEKNADAQPVLRLLAASYKNTNDDKWREKCGAFEPDGPEGADGSCAPDADLPERVLLDTPAISQILRDPSYEDSICSATCAAMMLCGKGEEVTPDEITLANYDYGFGGNGNWSFTTAAIGTYGYESYVSYASFRDVRKELADGNAVAFSVKYSRSKDGKYPYMENVPIQNTGGHLILIVGYYYDKEAGEYVYYANDPAANTDLEAGHREYRGHQLSGAWYRRAVYVAHGKISDGKYARIRESAKLMPCAGEGPVACAKFRLVAKDGRTIRLAEDFTEDPRENFGGHGTILVTIPGRKSVIPSGARRTAANDLAYFGCVSVDADGTLTLKSDAAEALKKGLSPKITIITNDGYIYEAEVPASGASGRSAHSTGSGHNDNGSHGMGGSHSEGSSYGGEEKSRGSEKPARRFTARDVVAVVFIVGSNILIKSLLKKRSERRKNRIEKKNLR